MALREEGPVREFPRVVPGGINLPGPATPEPPAPPSAANPAPTPITPIGAVTPGPTLPPIPVPPVVPIAPGSFARPGENPALRSPAFFAGRQEGPIAGKGRGQGKGLLTAPGQAGPAVGPTEADLERLLERLAVKRTRGQGF